MVELLKRRQVLWQLLEHVSEKPPMLRLSRDDDCFWICDLPRRCSEAICDDTKAKATQAGFVIHLDETSKLWRIDLTLTDTLFAVQPAQRVPFPRREALHPVYGLYRLLSAHPAPLEEQPRELLRGILKLTTQPPDDHTQTTQLTAQCAALLNRKRFLPSAACFALAHYIGQEDEQ